MSNVNGLFDFIKKSPSAYHAVSTVADVLRENGFSELRECDAWELRDGGKYFVTRAGSSIIAFVHKSKLACYDIVAAHSDTPSFRLKCEPECGGAYSRLNVERYGGPV